MRQFVNNLNNNLKFAQGKIENMASNRTILACIVMASVIAVGHTLQCHQCGQYNDGVGSITPCLNYTDQSAHLYLKDCPRSSDKFCIVSIHFSK